MKPSRRIFALILAIASLASVTLGGTSCSSSGSKPDAVVTTEPGDPNSVSPFIDSVKRGLAPSKSPDESGEVPDPYIENIKKDLKPDDSTDYSAKERAKLKDQASSQGYAEQEKAKLQPQDEGGAIAALNEGRSELHAIRTGEPHNEFGLRVGSILSRSITAPQGVQNQPFANVYGTNYSPDIDFFYDKEIIPHLGFGKLSLRGMIGVSYFGGNGTYAVTNLTYGYTPRDASNPALTSIPVGTVSQTKFQFFTFPLVAGANYSFNLGKYFRPFANAGPAAIPYSEIRLDSSHGHNGYSFGFMEAAGISILLDGLSGSNTTDLYYEHGVKHYYLNVEYSNISTFNGDVSISASGLYAGLSFEY